MNKDLYSKSCKTESCKYCKYILECSYLRMKKFFLPMLSNSDCHSTGVIYIIKCLLCDYYYVGETGRKASQRIGQHLLGIKNFIPYTKVISEVAEHFRLKGHNVDRDFKFCIFRKGIDDKKARLSIEANIIHIIMQFKPLINEKIPNLFYLKELSFK